MTSRDEIVCARLSPAEADEVRAAAAAVGESVSGYLRGAVLREVLASQPGARSYRTGAGAPIVVVSS